MDNITEKKEESGRNNNEQLVEDSYEIDSLNNDVENLEDEPSDNSFLIIEDGDDSIDNIFENNQTTNCENENNNKKKYINEDEKNSVVIVAEEVITTDDVIQKVSQ